MASYTIHEVVGKNALVQARRDLGTADETFIESGRWLSVVDATYQVNRDREAMATATAGLIGILGKMPATPDADSVDALRTARSKVNNCRISLRLSVRSLEAALGLGQDETADLEAGA